MVATRRARKGRRAGEEGQEPGKGILEQARQTLNMIDPKLARLFIPWALRHPRYLRGGARLVRGYRSSRSTREEAKVQGLVVPSQLK